jgi:hypothetical protein
MTLATEAGRARRLTAAPAYLATVDELSGAA